MGLCSAGLERKGRVECARTGSKIFLTWRKTKEQRIEQN